MYRKPTHTDQYLAYDSHHPLVHKRGVVKTLVDRNDRVTSEPSDKVKDIEHIKKVLAVSGYPRNVVDRSKSTRSMSKKDKQENKGMIVLPYIQGTTEKLKRIFQKRELKVAIKPHQTIRNMLVHPKDQIPKEKKTGVVYKIPCKTCNKSYIGETGRTLETRLKEHKRDANQATNRPYTRGNRTEAQDIRHKSAITDHCARENCVIDWDNTSILDREDNHEIRQIKEAVHIRNNKCMNRDQGNYILSTAYDSILSKLQTSDQRTHGKLPTSAAARH